jgi:ABC-2 type transport system ATP-binding protein
MSVIQVENLTKDYGFGRGVFDISFDIAKGEVFGFLGPNGSGKTTTIRHIMGFSKPQSGHTSINGMDSWKNSAKIQRNTGYLPGEIALPEGLTGTEFLRMMAGMRGMKDTVYLKTLLDRFELDPNVNTKRMSLGVKRKLAVVTAFMHDPEVIILDEPTSGLDPVMQHNFIEFVNSEKKRGKTILMSSHIFSEVDATCDRIAIIKDGHIMDTFVADDLRHSSNKVYQIAFTDIDGFNKFMSMNFELSYSDPVKRKVKVVITDTDINSLIEATAYIPMVYFKEIKFTLEDYFMKFYKEDKVFEGVR